MIAYKQKQKKTTFTSHSYESLSPRSGCGPVESDIDIGGLAYDISEGSLRVPRKTIGLYDILN